MNAFRTATLPAVALIVALATSGMLVSLGVSAAESERLTRSSGDYSEDGAADEKRDPDSLVDLSVDADDQSSSRANLGVVQRESSLCCAYWIYQARTRLFDDFDGDGHYTYLRVNFDIDTSYFDADVYVRLFLRGFDGRWTLIFESDPFSIYGTSANDVYEVETELVAGYPPDDYDVLIEVYEAFYGDLVTEYGPADNSSLSYLPLEDISFDNRSLPPVAVSRGGGGATSFDFLILLLFAALAMVGGDKTRSRPGGQVDRLGPLHWANPSLFATRPAQGARRRHGQTGVARRRRHDGWR